MNRWKKDGIERQMLTFINLLENFSQNEDDIVHIIDRANQYTLSPLHEILSDYVVEARMCADSNAALEHLERNLEGTKLQEVFHALWICSKHDANYSEVIWDCKISVKEYLKSKSIRNAIIRSARVDVGALVIAGWFVIQIMDDFVEMSVWTVMSTTYIGIGILMYCLMILCGAVYYLFWR